MEMNYLTYQLNNLKDIIDNQNGKNLKKSLQTLVPEYKPENRGDVGKIVEFKNSSKAIVEK